MCKLRCSEFRIMTYLLTWLTLITMATGMYLMNGYEIVKVHIRSPLAGKQLKELLSHVFPHSEPVFSGLFQNFFIFFLAAEIDLTTEEIDVRSISAIFL